MHQRGRLQRLPRRLVEESSRGKLAQFIVNERKKFTGRLAVAVLSRQQQIADL